MFPFDPSEIITKPLVFWRFQDDQKEHWDERGQPSRVLKNNFLDFLCGVGTLEIAVE